MKIIFKTQFGSHLYGTNVETSDHDYKAIRLPSADEILLSQIQKTIVSSTKENERVKNSSEDIDTEIFSLDQYMKLLLEGQAVAIDMFFSPQSMVLSRNQEIWTEMIYDNKKHWLHSNISPYVGYCRQQANKYGIKGSRVAALRQAVEFFKNKQTQLSHLAKLREFWDDLEITFANVEHCEFVVEKMRGREDHSVRMFSCCNRKVQEHITIKEAIKIFQHIFDEYGARALQAEKNENVDWKALSHAVRICHEAIELLLTHNITFPRPEKDLLLQIRKGELPYEEVAEKIEQGWIDLEDAMKKSTLPPAPNLAFKDAVIKEVYAEINKKDYE